MFPFLRHLFFLVSLLCVQTLSWAEGTDSSSDYRPGKGWQIPGTGFKLGGYANVSNDDDRHDSTKFGIEDFSLFVHWESEGKLRLFSELDLEQPLAWEEGRGLTTSHSYLALERLYADYLYSEKLNFRIGKFLTPIGRWNVIHAAPLEWTTSRPLVTERTFPTNATGAMAYGTLPVFDSILDYSLYTSVGEEWRPDPKLDPFEEAYGLHINLPIKDEQELGLSLANFEQKGSIGESKNLVGIDYSWVHNRYEITAEAVYRFSDKGGNADEKGLYIQGVVPISERWYGIGRYEFYDQAGSAAAVNVWLAGIAMHLSPAMVLKAEYSHVSNNQIRVPEGFFASFAILF